MVIHPSRMLLGHLEEVVIDKVVSSLRTVIPLRELSIKFTISQRQVE
jgi:hypothetical protein